MRELTVLHYVNPAEMACENKICVFCVSDVELVKPEDALNFCDLARLRKTGGRTGFLFPELQIKTGFPVSRPYFRQ